MREVPLGGLDNFHLVNDWQMQSVGLPGNHCAYVVRLDGRVDMAWLSSRLAAAASALPELGARLHRSLLGGPTWRFECAPPPRLGRISVEDSGGLDAALETLLEERIGPNERWAFDVLSDGDSDALVFRWFHPLMDGRGAERFLTWLGAGEGKQPAAAPPSEKRFQTSDRVLAKFDRNARIGMVRAFGKHMGGLGAQPIRSFSTLAGRHLGRTRIQRLRLSEEETARFDEGVRRIARLGETAVMVASTVRVLDRGFGRRGDRGEQYLVPVPLSLDPKIGSERMFGNNLTMMMFRLRRAELDDLSVAVASLLDQQRQIVRQKLDIGMIAALDFARHLPPRISHWFTTRPFGGEMSSVVLSNPGSISLAKFGAHRVLDAFPLPTVVAPPGIQLIFTRHAGCLSVLCVYVDGAVSGREASRFLAELRRDMCDSPAQ